VTAGTAFVVPWVEAGFGAGSSGCCGVVLARWGSSTEGVIVFDGSRKQVSAMIVKFQVQWMHTLGVFLFILFDVL
jgi:hypothetical protein